MAEEQERPAPRADLFRKDALDHHLGESGEGDVLRLSPAWTRWTFWFLSVTVLVGLAYLILATVPIYEGGAAVFQVEGRMAVISPIAGTIERIEVAPRQRVTAGELLVWFDAGDERAELDRSTREFEQQLIRRLNAPEDAQAAATLSRLRVDRDRLLTRLDRRAIKAPGEGVVHDVRIRQGQYLEQGEHVLSLFPVEHSYEVVAMLPGYVLPQLKVGMNVRLAVIGYPYAYLSAKVTSVGEQVIGPMEMRRSLSSEIADSVGLSGPMARVEIQLDSDLFQAGTHELKLHDGMLATAEIEVRQERLLFRLIPGLKTLRGQRNG